MIVAYSRMMQTNAKSDRNSQPAELSFYDDFEKSIKGLSRVFTGILVLIALLLWKEWSTAEADADIPQVTLLLFIVMFVLGYASEVVRNRAIKGLPAITLGPDGVSFPQNDIGPISWGKVQVIRHRRQNIRGANLTYLNFFFRDGTLHKRQLGALRADKWEILISSGSWLFGQNERFTVGSETLFDAIEKHHPIENR